MPSIEFGDRYQKAVLWSQVTVDRYGEPDLSAPVEILVRWVDGQTDLLAEDQSKVRVDATVQVFRVLQIGDLMWLGKLADWYGSGSGGQDDDVMRVAYRKHVPDLKGRMFKRFVGLSKHKDTPT